MTDQYLGEIRIFGFNFAPKGWAFCNGQLLSIQQNTALFSLLGTNYGGNGIQTFGLPNLQGRIPVSSGSNFVLGETSGEVNHTLTLSEMAAHTHLANASSAPANQPAPNGGFWANGNQPAYVAGTPNIIMTPTAVGNTGGSQPHANMQPYLVVNFCIALQGIFPSRS